MGIIVRVLGLLFCVCGLLSRRIGRGLSSRRRRDLIVFVVSSFLFIVSCPDVSEEFEETAMFLIFNLEFLLEYEFYSSNSWTAECR